MSLTLERMFNDKDPSEVLALAFDFGETIDPLLTATVTCTHVDGVGDAAAATMILGSPAVVGTKVVFYVRNGVNRAEYELRCQASTATQVLVMAGGLRVIRARSKASLS